MGNGEKTADSEKLEVALRDSTQSLNEDAARPVVTLAEANNTQPAQNESQAGGDYHHTPGQQLRGRGHPRHPRNRRPCGLTPIL